MSKDQRRKLGEERAAQLRIQSFAIDKALPGQYWVMAAEEVWDLLGEAKAFAGPLNSNEITHYKLEIPKAKESPERQLLRAITIYLENKTYDMSASNLAARARELLK